MLTERQQQAEMLARELSKLGAMVVSPLPLADDKRLRFHILDQDRPRILQTLSSWAWSPMWCGNTAQLCPADGTMRLIAVYEIRIGDDRQPIPRDDIKQDEVISKELKEYRREFGR